MSATLLLERLDKVRQTGRGSWVACCPSHADTSPSLSIRETDDGLLLVHCFAGCDVSEVLAAAGLSMDALFPARTTHHGKPLRRAFPAADALRAVSCEALVVVSAGVVNNNLELIHPSAPHQLKTDPLGLVPAPFWLGCFELASAVGQLLRLKRILPSGGHSAKVTGDVNLTG